MARAKIYHAPGFVWHISHRCHNKEFLLKFIQDRKNWILWLFKAKKKYDLVILDYMVTSNHIHLLVYDDGRRDVISRSMLLVASRTAINYNNRKKRSGAFWEDNYHATAVENDKHFLECLLYIDLNMVRAGIVNHPKDWPMSGYNEIMGNQKKRYRLINKTKLMQLLGISNFSQLQQNYEYWIKEKLTSRPLRRQEKWTEALAVGSKNFIKKYQKTIGIKVHHKIYNDGEGMFSLK
ncbi:MAG: transposase [Candidatus Aminicenantes bacterium]|nr:transposase [Candidatus Aminicenantes bacterium]